MSRKPKKTLLLHIFAALIGIIFGFILGASLRRLDVSPIYVRNHPPVATNQTPNDTSKFWVQRNPRGTERLPRGIVESESDLYLRRFWGDPSEDLINKAKYVAAFAVGFEQRKNVEELIKKFSDNFTIVLFHYDGRTSEWEIFEWYKRVIHVSARQQTKWWFAKRYLHPDIVAPYDYVFIWDEDLGVDHFNSEKYIELVKKHGLEISQPAVEPQGDSKLMWQMTKRRDDIEVHKEANETAEIWCKEPQTPPCAGFVEIMAPVFSRDAWRCVWHMMQSDLVHGWGIDFDLYKCAKPAHEKIGVVDAQWIIHKGIPSLGNQSDPSLPPGGKSLRQEVQERGMREWEILRNRWKNAEESHT